VVAMVVVMVMTWSSFLCFVSRQFEFW